MLTYLDTSALFKLFVMEKGSENVAAIVAGQSEALPITDLQHAEITNVFYLKVFQGSLTVEQAKERQARFLARFQEEIFFTPEIDRSRLMRSFEWLAQFTPELGCRTLDILHVAYALQLDTRLFVTFDERQRELAKRARLEAAEVG